MSSVIPKKFLGILTCIALLCAMIAWVPAPRTAQAQEVKKFTILHTNDEHSEIIPADVSIDYPTYPTTGGFSRIAHEIGRIKTEKVAAGEPVVTVSAGDFSQGTNFAWLETSAAVELSLMQAMGYDMVALGNHEFEEGAEYRYGALMAAKMAAGVKLPILCSNIKFNPDNVTYPGAAHLKTLWSDADLQGTALAIQPYTIKNLPNGLNVGFFSLMGVEAEAVAPMAAATGITFGNDPTLEATDPANFLTRVFTAQNMVNTLKGAGCDVVVCVSHCGTTEELELTNYVNDLDVIIGGHSHSLNYPPIIKNGVIVVQAGAYSKYLGELELAYDETTGEVSVRNGQAIKIDDSIPTTPALDAPIASYITAINTTFGPIFGTIFGTNIMAPMAETDLAGNGGFNINAGPSFTETNLGDLITDAYVTIGSAVSPEPIQLGIEANGVIRSGILKGGTGIFNFYDLYRALPLGATPDPTQLMPFGYPLCAFYLLGAEIQGALDATLGMDNNEFFLQMSGGRYTYRPSGPAGSRIVSLEVFDAGSGSYKPITPTGLYKIATNFYTASFLELFGLKPRTNTGALSTVFASRVLAGPNEIKAWMALANYVMAMPDQDGDGLPNILPAYMYPQQRIAAVWNMAEGSTGGDMETFVLVQNTGDAAAHVNVKFLTGTGEEAPESLQGVEIPAKSRSTFKANDYVPDNYDVSIMVEPIDGFVVCERAVYGNGRTWATDSIGATAPSPSAEWYLAEGSTMGGMETFVLVENPYATDVTANISFQTEDGEVAPVELQGVNIPAQSRRTFKANDYVSSYDVSTKVTCVDGVLVCERAVYGGDRTWGTDSIGATASAPTWYLAEGSTLGGMETFVLVQNPGGEDVLVNLAFQTKDGEVAPTELQGVNIPARSRCTFKANDYVSSYDVSTKVTCVNGDVVCERAMYGDSRTWAHDSIGAMSPGTNWYLAEGSTGGGMETFVLIQNPNATEAVVNITFQTGTGEETPAELQGLALPANSRRTFKVNDYVPDNYDVSSRVTATDGQVICERAMYGDSRTWATDSIGFSR